MKPQNIDTGAAIQAVKNLCETIERRTNDFRLMDEADEALNAVTAALSGTASGFEWHEKSCAQPLFWVEASGACRGKVEFRHGYWHWFAYEPDNQNEETAYGTARNLETAKADCESAIREHDAKVAA